MAQHAYRLRVQLMEIEPAIFRVLVVDPNVTLGDLHAILQTAMGWKAYHMHEFRVRGVRYSDSDWALENPAVLDEWEVTLKDVAGRKGVSLEYLYDFGDDWLHNITIEAVVPVRARSTPFCEEGARSCPPEDCGGVFGYYELLDALEDPTHERHEEFREWIGDDYDPEEFDRSSVNRVLENLAPD
ncbi:MAG: plasmid pRiA4b ORF-3 family protein [Planctomycetota bacterium]